MCEISINQSEKEHRQTIEKEVIISITRFESAYLLESCRGWRHIFELTELEIVFWGITICSTFGFCEV